MGRLIDADKMKEYLQNRLKEAEEKFAYEESKKKARHVTKLLCDDVDAQETVDAIPLDWINGYINWLNSISAAMAAADVNAIKSMLTKWKLDNNGPVCGPDYCEIGGTHDE